MFTENIKFHRSNRGFSQEKLAEAADVSLRTIQRLESGETEPRGDTVARIAKALDIPPGDLLQFMFSRSGMVKQVGLNHQLNSLSRIFQGETPVVFCPPHVGCIGDFNSRMNAPCRAHKKKERE
jgi:transcriptional regulator with XRE-family HTH domain